MEKNKITGGCYCGEVRFSASPEVRVQTNCHCQNCRRAAGAQAVAWIIVKRSQFQFVKGTPRRYQTETGTWRTFCDRCGTSLTYETDKRPMRSTLPLEVSIIRKISRQRRMFTRRNGCPGSISSVIELASSRLPSAPAQRSSRRRSNLRYAAISCAVLHQTGSRESNTRSFAVAHITR
jgi:hypothetical protein